MLEDPQVATLPTQLGEAFTLSSTGQRFVSVPAHAADADEDHFLIFSRRDELAEWVLAFLRSQPGFDSEHGNRETDR